MISRKELTKIIDHTNIRPTATVEDIKLMRITVGPNMGVKASAGIRTLRRALTMIDASANRIGTSTGSQVVEGIP
jgi:deoxyribose-phosphate aldolase